MLHSRRDKPTGASTPPREDERTRPAYQAGRGMRPIAGPGARKRHIPPAQ